MSGAMVRTYIAPVYEGIEAYDRERPDDLSGRVDVGTDNLADKIGRHADDPDHGD